MVTSGTESIDLDNLPDTAPTLQRAIVTRKLIDKATNPNLAFRDTMVLRENKRGAIAAEHVQVINQKTGQPHHSYVKLTYLKRQPKSKGGALVISMPKDIIIDDDQTDEISMLRDFLNVVKGAALPNEDGKYLMLRVDDDEDAENLTRLRSVLSDSTMSQLALEVLETVGQDAGLLQQVSELATSNPDTVRIASAALKLGQYSVAIEKLEAMIAENPTEGRFQEHLNANPWMFGSDYSELLDQRDFVQGQITDFPLRRTADGCLEVFEIKRPFTEPLFVYDRSHESWYPRRDLSQAVGQIMGYIDELDAQRDTIWRRHKILVHKVRAKIVIGRDSDENQAEALRRFNSHLNRIEVLTFDQLSKIAQNVTSHLKSVVDTARATGAVDDVPF